MSVLVTGGAGYIGSHIVRLLEKRIEKLVIVDDLSAGRASRIGGHPLVELDLSNNAAVDVLQRTMAEHEVHSVIHLAARKEVGDSMRRPTHYMRQNVGGLTNLLEAMEISGVRNIIYSSSAAVYGSPDVEMVRENDACNPINTYGETKLIGEWMCERSSAAWGLVATSLRYFNVAGAGWPDLGDPTSLNLVPMVFDRLAAGDQPSVFGADYETRDGSCIRDYVHVLDLAEAHTAALSALDTGHSIFNIGTGRGSSVLEVVDEIGRATGLDATPRIVDRRAGDPAQLVASVEKAADELGWRSKRDLAEIVSSAWQAYLNR